MDSAIRSAQRVTAEVLARTVTRRELLVGSYRDCVRTRGTDVVALAAVDGRRDLGELLIERAPCPK